MCRNNHKSEIRNQKSPFLRRCARDGILGLLGIMLFAGSAWGWYPRPSTPYPTNNDRNNQIRFDTPAGADAKRQQLTDWIWSGGLPTATLPGVTNNISFPGDLDGINESLVSRVDKLDANVSGMDFHAISYLIHPKNTAHVNRLAIVHQGHSDYYHSMSYGIGNTANRLLQEGYSVIAMQMPRCGWNTDSTIVLPEGEGTVHIGCDGSRGHDEMFHKIGGSTLPDGAVFRFFLEPVVQSINHFQNLPGNSEDVGMTGLSGGGWTTHMAAALDTRIKLSVPVAGSAPLYISNWYYPNPTELRDSEQVHFPLYSEDIAADGSGGGVATWMECYALGGYGDDRQQIMVLNELEASSLFPHTYPSDMAYEGIVSDVVDDLGQGDWDQRVDAGQTTHQISSWTIENVIVPAMPVPEPSTCVLAARGLLGFGLYTWRKGKQRKCRMLDGGWRKCRGRRVRH